MAAVNWTWYNDTEFPTIFEIRKSFKLALSGDPIRSGYSGGIDVNVAGTELTVGFQRTEVYDSPPPHRQFDPR